MSIEFKNEDNINKLKKKYIMINRENDDLREIAIKKATSNVEEAFEKIGDIEKLNEKNIDDLKKHIINSVSEDEFMLRRSYQLRIRKYIKQEELIDELNLQNAKYINDLKIKSPEWGSEPTEYQKSLSVLIKEINNCYETGSYTAVGLLSRKFIMNLVFVLSEQEGIKIVDKELNLSVSGKKRIFIKSSNDSGISSRISWLYFHRFLTRKGRDLLEKMTDDANEVSHQHLVEVNEEDTRKYYLTIKGLIESNFNIQNIKFSKDIEKEEFEEIIDE